MRSARANWTSRHRFDHGIRSPKNQHGALLITVLIILLLMTVLAVSGVGNSVLEQKMAGNYYHSTTAFEAAEFGVSVAEDWLNRAVTRQADLDWFTTINAINGLYTTQDPAAVNTVEVCRGDIDCYFDAREEDEWNDVSAASPLPKGFITLGDTVQGITLDTYAMPVAGQPRFIIEYLGKTGGLTEISLTDPSYDDPQDAFRITVIAWGHEGVARHVLQSNFILSLDL